MGTIIVFIVIIVICLRQLEIPSAAKNTKKTSNQRLKSNKIKPECIKAKSVFNRQSDTSNKDLAISMMEDRKGDWLAMQMREEQKLLKKGDLLDLGANHNKRCAAKEIKLMHILEHDDSIDNGEV